MKVYIGFARPKKFTLFSELIMLIEKRDYDHVYIRIREPEYNLPMVFQASKLLVNLMSSHIFQSENIAVKEYEIDITDDQAKLLYSFIMQNLGLPYSFMEDVGILIMKIFQTKSNLFNADGSAAFCSQLGAQVCTLIGISIPQDSSTITPSNLDYILSQTTNKLIQNPVFV